MQMINVSTNGPIPATTPSRMGSFVLAAAWAMAADPSPASFEKHARFNPHVNAIHTDTPAQAPVSATGVNAEVTIRARYFGTSAACRITT